MVLIAPCFASDAGKCWLQTFLPLRQEHRTRRESRGAQVSHDRRQEQQCKYHTPPHISEELKWSDNYQ